MLAVSNISKSYGIKPILSGVSFTIKPGERIGLVGPNGCGKTTLMRILNGDESADHGSVRTTPSDLRVGYLPQGLEFRTEETIGDFINRYRGNMDRLAQQLESLSEKIALSPDDSPSHQMYDAVLQEINLLAANPDRSPEILAALGLDQFEENTPVAYLSGGQKTRLALAGVLLSNPQLILLDEPTNHLDIEMLEWLEEWLSRSPYSALIVSHDRAFLDNVTTGILELDTSTHKVREYAGNYSTYLDQKQAEHDRQWQEYSDQQEEISRLRSSAAHLRGLAKFRKGGKADTGDKFAKGFFANRGLGTVGRAKNIEQRIEHLLTDEHVEKPRQSWQLKIEFSGVQASGRDVMVLESLDIGYDSAEPLGSQINLTLRHGQRVALIGPNGAGKSTLLKTITGAIPSLAGKVRLGSNVRVGYMAQEQENLLPEDTPLIAVARIVGASETEVRSFLSKYLIMGDDVFTPVQSMSYGERSRLSLACLVAQGCNFLLLDEPVNHLDIPSRVRFEEALKNFDGTILAVVHDRYFIQAFATSIWEFRNRQVVVIR
jgi:ATP-binding cassette subfamily F protein 3